MSRLRDLYFTHDAIAAVNTEVAVKVKEKHNAIAAVNTAVGRHENVLKWRHQLSYHSPDGRTDHNPND